MATTPCTLVIFTEDKIHFPITTALTVMKHLFQYGVKDIKIKGDDKIFLSLTYSPKEKTLKKSLAIFP
ncbi:unnamed protein product [Tenebrio molitor]|nr:unnamed protein product [Tenebrio molitor]